MQKLFLSKFIAGFGLAVLVFGLMFSGLADLPVQAALAVDETEVLGSPSNTSSSLNNQIYQQGSDGSQVDLTLMVTDPCATSTFNPTDLGGNAKCFGNFMMNLPGIAVFIITQILGALTDIASYVILVLIEYLLSQNPTAQDSDFFALAMQAYSVTLSIANLMILFSFFYVGYKYLFGIQEKRVAWQEFLIKVVVATILVNFSIFLVSIFVSLVHDIGTLLINLFTRGEGGNISGAFQNAIKRAGGFDAKSFGPDLQGIFASPVNFYPKILTKFVYPIVGVFIIIEEVKLIKVALTRFVLLFLLLVVSPVAIVGYFSPIDAFRKQGQEWLTTLWVQTSLYPVFIITLGIGGVFVVGVADAAADSLSSFDETIMGVFGLLAAYGVMKMLVVFFEKSFKGVAEGLWKQMGTTVMAMGAVGGASMVVGGHIVRNAIAGAKKGAEFGLKHDRSGLSAGMLGLAGGVVGAYAGAVKGGFDFKGLAVGARRGAFMTGNIVDSVLGNDSVARLTKGNKLLTAWKNQTDAEATLMADGAIRKTGQVLNDIDKREPKTKAGRFLRSAVAKAGLDFTKNIDLEDAAANFADNFMPENANRGMLGSELSNFQDRLQQAKGQGQEAWRKSMGIAPRPTKSLLRGLTLATKNGGKYLDNQSNIDQFVEALIKDPSLASEMTADHVALFQNEENYQKIIASNPKLEETLRTQLPHLASEEARRRFAQHAASLQIGSPEFQKIRKDAFRDPVFAQALLDNIDQDEIPNLSQSTGIDFSSYRRSQSIGNLGSMNAPTEQRKRALNDTLDQMSVTGLSNNARKVWQRNVESSIVDTVRRRTGKSDLTDETALGMAKHDDIQKAFRKTASSAVQAEFYGDNKEETKQAVASATSAKQLTDILAKGEKGRMFIQNWQASHGGREITDSDVNDIKADLTQIVSHIEGVLGHENNATIQTQADAYISVNNRYKEAQREYDQRYKAGEFKSQQPQTPSSAQQPNSNQTQQANNNSRLSNNPQVNAGPVAGGVAGLCTPTGAPLRPVQQQNPPQPSPSQAQPSQSQPSQSQQPNLNQTPAPSPTSTQQSPSQAQPSQSQQAPQAPVPTVQISISPAQLQKLATDFQVSMQEIKQLGDQVNSPAGGAQAESIKRNIGDYIGNIIKNARSLYTKLREEHKVPTTQLQQLFNDYQQRFKEIVDEYGTMEKPKNREKVNPQAARALFDALERIIASISNNP